MTSTWMGEERVLRQIRVADSRRRLVDLSGVRPADVEVRLSQAAEGTVREVEVRLAAYVLGEQYPEPPFRGHGSYVLPTSWVQMWKLGRPTWSPQVRNPLAEWAIRHPRLARPLLRGPAGRWALRRPLSSRLERRYPARTRLRTMVVEVERQVVYPHAQVPIPELGRPVVLYSGHSLRWDEVDPFASHPTPPGRP